MEKDWSELVTTFWVRSDDVNIGDVVVVVLELISMEIILRQKWGYKCGGVEMDFF